MPYNKKVTVAERYQKPKPVLKCPAVNESSEKFHHLQRMIYWSSLIG